MDLLLIVDENKSHCVYIKYFNRFMCNKTKNKNIKNFCRYCLLCFNSKKVLLEHKKVCLRINGKQSTKLRSGSIKFKYYFKQLTETFNIYANFESVLKGVQSNDNDSNTSCIEKYQSHVPCSFAYKIVCIDDKSSKPVVLYKGKKKCIQ